jgi:hypothetical protein
MALRLGSYLGLVLTSVVLLAGFVLAFGALTIIWRSHWQTLGPSESLLARLAASGLMTTFALVGAQYFVTAVVEVLQTNQPFAPTVENRNQALAVISVALVLTVIASLRIELYHRRAIGISHRGESEEEWQTEEPEEKRAPRER